VTIESGEEGEATLLQCRAKLFTMSDKQWKEAGVGALKLNVPKYCVDYDSHGEPILGTFDPSGRDEDAEEDEPVSVFARLIMRQDNTHRVVLNTPIIKGLQFDEKPGAVASNRVSIIFTGFAEGIHKPMLLKVILLLGG
jgi:hypothetical protein